MSVFIIAEAGVCHNGDVNLAKKMIDVAVQAGVDAIKFQTWKTDLIVTKEASQAKYQIDNTGKVESQYDMLKKLELTYDDFKELKRYCDDKNIIFMSTPDEEVSANFLSNLQNIFKIGSGELTNVPFLRYIGTLQKKIILSTGMSTMDEIEKALNILIDAGTRKANITVLHANTQYPTPMQDVNLKAMISIKDKFDIEVGYSDHTLGIEVDIAAVALGATVIEKHFTLSKSMQGPDHKSSIEPKELTEMVKAIRNIEKALGDGEKKPSLSEIPNMDVVRKSIVAKKSIKKGETLDIKNICTKRSTKGISAINWDVILGTQAKKNYNKDDLI